LPEKSCRTVATAAGVGFEVGLRPAVEI
jgi:hypothetical protein